MIGQSLPGISNTSPNTLLSFLSARPATRPFHTARKVVDEVDVERLSELAFGQFEEAVAVLHAPLFERGAVEHRRVREVQPLLGARVLARLHHLIVV